MSIPSYWLRQFTGHRYFPRCFRRQRLPRYRRRHRRKARSASVGYLFDVAWVMLTALWRSTLAALLFVSIERLLKFRVRLTLSLSIDTDLLIMKKKTSRQQNAISSNTPVSNARTLKCVIQWRYVIKRYLSRSELLESTNVTLYSLKTSIFCLSVTSFKL